MTRTSAKYTFSAAAKRAGMRSLTFASAYDTLIRNITVSLKVSPDENAIEPEIRSHFQNFMVSLNYHLALKNFDALLKEKGGKNIKRDNGDIGWYHEFIPALMMMSIIRKDILPKKEVERYGGIEVMICTRLRHDSLEDFVRSKRKLHDDLIDMIDQIETEIPNYNYERGEKQIAQILTNVDLLSQRKEIDRETGRILKDEKGKQTKEDVKEYSKRMVTSVDANPLVYIDKQGDAIHNFATLFSPKFTPDRRLKRCNEREDMYGPRIGFTDAAIKKWPGCSKAIQVFDHVMGQLLYPHFRYLESVDQHYKSHFDFPVSSRYLNKALKIDLPEQFNPIHIFFKRMKTSVDPATDPEKYARLVNFMETVIKPSLKGHKKDFPYLFDAAQNDNHPIPSPAPVAM